MEMSDRESASVKAADFIELLSQDLPWDDIDRALGSKPSNPEHEFNADDLSLFSAFVDSLPPVAPQPSCDTKADVPVDEGADAAADVAQNIETHLHGEDFDCPDKISVCSQIEDMIADILDDEHPADNGSEAGDRSELGLHVDDNALNSDASHEEQAELQCGAGSSSNDWSSMKEGTVTGESSSLLLHSETVSAAARLNKADDESRCQYYDDSSDDDDDDDDDELTSSQEWVCDQLHTHIAQQHDEALRVNSLRLRLPALPANTSVRRDPICRAIHAFTTEIAATKLNIKLTDALRAENPNVSDCCKLLGDYNPHNLSPGVLVQYPFFAGTMDACCRWEGHLQDELHTAARRLRGFMMAMYERDSVDEGFLTALNRQVTAHRRALAVPANAAMLTRLTSKRRELSGLSEFRRSLYYDWDMFMAQFYDPDHQRRSNEHFSSAGNADRWDSNSGRKPADRPTATSRPTHNVATRSQFRTTVLDQPMMVSDVSASEINSTINANLTATGPQFETDDSASVLSAQAAGAEMSSAEDATMVMSRRSCDVTTVGLLDEIVDHTLRSGRRYKRSVFDEFGHMTSFKAENELVRHSSLAVKDRGLRRGKRSVSETSADANGSAKRQRGRLRKSVSMGRGEAEDIKPVIGSTEKRRNRRAKQMTGATNAVGDVGRPSRTSFEERDIKPDLSSLNISVASANVDVTARTRRSRSSKSASASHVEAEDIKPVVGSIDKRKDSQPKQSKLSARSGTTGATNRPWPTPVCASSEEQDIKPDLASLNMNVASANVDVTANLRRERSSDCVSVSRVETEDIKPVIGPIEKGRNSKTIGTPSTPAYSSFEEQPDVKPDLSSLNINVASANVDVTANLRRGRSMKCGISSEDKSIEQVIGSVDRRRKCPKRERSCLSVDRRSTSKNAGSVDVGRGTPVTGREMQDHDVKPDLASLEVATVGRKRDRPKRMCSVRPVISSTMHCTKQLPTTADASECTGTGEKRARGSGQRWFQCDVCLKIFNRKLSFIQHKRAGHGPPPTADGTFPCEICTKTFVHRSSLNRHRRTSHGFPSTLAATTAPATNASPRSPPFRLLSPSQIEVEVES